MVERSGCALRALAFCGLALAVLLTACQAVWLRSDGVHFVEYPELVFVNGSETSIGAVGVSSDLESEVAGNAGRAPMDHGETLSFGISDWPAVLAVFEDMEATRELARVVVLEPPAAGERWVVTAVDGVEGLELELSGEAIHRIYDGERGAG